MASEYDGQTLREWDRDHVWHPFTPHDVYAAESPLMVVAGEGHRLIDADGKSYIDAVGSLWCNLFGHKRPEIDRAINEQLKRIAHATFLGNASAPGVVLAKRLAEAAPGDLDKVFYSDSGSTAVEVAIKMALQYWQQQPDDTQRKRRRFLAFGEAYHGDTVGAVSVGGMDLFHARFQPLLFDVIRCPSPYAARDVSKSDSDWREQAMATLSRLMDEHGSHLAAVVLEPGMQGAAGMLTQPTGYVRAVRELCDKHGTLLILDEVAMGMGRTGQLFASEFEDVVPDFLCLAKGLTAGYLPLAATLTKSEIFDAFLGPPHEGRTFFHGHTYTGNALGSAAALATLDIFESEGFLDAVKARIQTLSDALNQLKGLPWVKDIRQYGMAAGIEVFNPQTQLPFPAKERRGMRICTAAREAGVFLRPLGDVIVLMPPLTIEDKEIDQIVQAIEHGMKTALATKT